MRAAGRLKQGDKTKYCATVIYRYSFAAGGVLAGTARERDHRARRRAGSARRDGSGGLRHRHPGRGRTACRSRAAGRSQELNPVVMGMISSLQSGSRSCGQCEQSADILEGHEPHMKLPRYIGSACEKTSMHPACRPSTAGAVSSAGRITHAHLQKPDGRL